MNAEKGCQGKEQRPAVSQIGALPEKEENVGKGREHHQQEGQEELSFLAFEHKGHPLPIPEKEQAEDYRGQEKLYQIEQKEGSPGKGQGKAGEKAKEHR